MTPLEMNCAHCGKPFTPRSYPGGEPPKYCEHYCKNAAYEQANRDVRRARDRLRKRRLRAQGADIKQRARQKLADAIRSGQVERGPCEVGVGCRGRIEAHHDDYDKPLDVRWLCSTHHRRHHVASTAA